MYEYSGCREFMPAGRPDLVGPALAIEQVRRIDWLAHQALGTLRTGGPGSEQAALTFRGTLQHELDVLRTAVAAAERAVGQVLAQLPGDAPAPAQPTKIEEKAERKGRPK